jgi:hypothetical protein
MKIITADERLKQARNGEYDMGFELGDIVRANSVWLPQRILISSIQGLGKTTFGATFESAILAQIEDGAGAIDCATFPEQIKTFNDMEAVINALHGQHPYKNLVVDSADWLEKIIWKHLIQQQPTNDKGIEVNDIEDYGYGKGFSKAMPYWEYLKSGFESLRVNKGMGIIFLAHTDIKRYDPPESDPYDRYHIKLHKSAASFIQEWFDIVLFCNYKTRIEKTDVGFGKEVARGKGTGERVIYTEERPAFLAKNRWGLPPEIYIGTDRTWSAFHCAMEEATGGRYNNDGSHKAGQQHDEPGPQDERLSHHQRYDGANSRPPEGYDFKAESASENDQPAWSKEDDIPF